ncbi:DNA-binding FadR family transcriptional regulator [Naumannella cuiyingiana]|uniref:DNA-binding FadR family transcriptional regulator n=1 Tax=Naumannella cuiyingiana TaxID=1347891 RepID=A0A7Z0D7B2_9ACTN|nr:FCD domain-containing protein [Naumannella cuiyingiana]NYI70081.1 DNA-binding FadR family transcriptional regulator [Naumannella cuiyingiana]
MNTIRRAPLAEQAAEALLSRVRAGEWGLGHKLPGETTLSVQLGVGRSTVREAIRDLAGRGVLESRQGAGVFVTSLEPADDWDTVLARADVVAVIEARVAIEAEAAALAAGRRTPADLRTLRRTLADRSKLGTSPQVHVDADMAFHRAVVVAAHNEVLSELFDAFVPRVHRAMVDMLKISPLPWEDADHASHEVLFEAIRARDPLAAAEASRSQLQTLKDLYS